MAWLSERVSASKGDGTTEPAAELGFRMVGERAPYASPSHRSGSLPQRTVVRAGEPREPANGPPAVRKHDPEGMTFEQLATMWTSGDLAKRFPDHVQLERTANDDVSMARKYIYPLVGKVPVLTFKLDHAERVMAAIPASLSRATRRRHVGQIMHRVLSLAVFPMRSREANPLPRGWLPKLGAKKAKAWLHPTRTRVSSAA